MGGVVLQVEHIWDELIISYPDLDQGLDHIECGQCDSPWTLPDDKG